MATLVEQYKEEANRHISDFWHWAANVERRLAEVVAGVQEQLDQSQIFSRSTTMNTGAAGAVSGKVATVPPGNIWKITLVTSFGTPPGTVELYSDAISAPFLLGFMTPNAQGRGQIQGPEIYVMGGRDIFVNWLAQTVNTDVTILVQGKQFPIPPEIQTAVGEFQT